MSVLLWVWGDMIVSALSRAGVGVHSMGDNRMTGCGAARCNCRDDGASGFQDGRIIGTMGRERRNGGSTHGRF